MFNNVLRQGRQKKGAPGWRKSRGKETGLTRRGIRGKACRNQKFGGESEPERKGRDLRCWSKEGML